jgi:DNA-binding NarL/FixJ family response regulator
MEKILLFTKMSSIKNHWNKYLPQRYEAVNIDDFFSLTTYLDANDDAVILMLDEQSVSNILQALETLNGYSFVTVLLFNSVPEVYHASRLLGRGIKGYENAFIADVNLDKMLNAVEDGNSWLFAALTNFIIEKYVSANTPKEPAFMHFLTEKEKEIALMVAAGMSNKEIAQKQKSALSTVKGHIQHIFEKTGVSDRISLALKFK